MFFGSRKKAGVIGLGIIGSRVAANLRKNGYKTFVWNRSPRPEPNFLGSAAEIADACQHIQLFVPDEAALQSCLDALLPKLTAKHILLSHATISPQFTQKACEQVENTGAAFLDAPFTGSRDAAGRGELVYYIGGSEEVLEKSRPQLEATSKAILHIGQVGDAATVKLATNMITAVTVQTLTESLALVKAAGVTPEKFAEAVQLNACRSGVSDLKLSKIIQADYEPHFALKHMLKDMRFALQLAGQHDLELPATSVATATLLAAAHQGHSDEDFCAVAVNYGFVTTEAENHADAETQKETEEGESTEDTIATGEEPETEAPEEPSKPQSASEPETPKGTPAFPAVIPRRKSSLPKPPPPKVSTESSEEETFIDSSRTGFSTAELAEDEATEEK